MTEQIEILPLGAGQQVGRSCIVVRIKKSRTIIFDTGIHMQYNDMQKFPNFKYICGDKDINQVVDAVIITHFHLDHCGALPYLTQHHKYKGPIIATTPTKAMIPYMLQDFRKVTMDIKKDENKNNFTYSAAQGKMSAEKITSIGLKETMTVNGISITPYYAGHVLGAGMFYIEFEGLSVLYTGDYNSYADRHLGSAYAPRLNPNVIITQTTYATTIRDTKRDRERKMLKIVTQTLENGGKVLIPVFALGRAQQLSVLLETYWNRTQSQIPVYFSAGLIQKANFYYRLFIEWENQKIKEDFLENNTFNFKKVKPFDKSLIRADFPYVLFATPGMLHGGTSLQVFKQWCGNPKNTLIIPGYCVAGTFGNKLLNGVRKLDIDHRQYQVNMRIENISFSAHADAKGIINLIRHVNAENIVFVHGNKQKMQIFSEIVKQQLKKPVFMPANKQSIKISCKVRNKIQIKGQKQPSQTGYLMRHVDHKTITTNKKLKNQQQQYKLVKDQQHILCQLNLMKQLLFGINDNSTIIADHIQTQLQCCSNLYMQLQQTQMYHNKLISTKQKCIVTKQQNQQIKMQQQQQCNHTRMMDDMINQMLGMGSQNQIKQQQLRMQEENMKMQKQVKLQLQEHGEKRLIRGDIRNVCKAVVQAVSNKW